MFICRLIEVDDFIANLWNVHLAVKKEGFAQVDLKPVLECTNLY